MVLKEEDTGQEYVLKKRPVLTGELLVDARTGTGQDGEPVVSFRFNTQGARKFGEFSQKHVGDLFAIVLDKKVISAPVIREPILGGSGQISGNFTFQSAHDLALLLRAGALPAPLKVVEERTAGPSLGADSIAAGKKAAIIGVILVMAFMLIYYKTFGMFSNVALIVNIILILAALSILQATLTLPGIAGIVLTIGMAVDANVLIFERIREEAQMGKSSAAAVSAGFSRAFKTIIDSNITTLIAALLLYYFGSGSVRGFAVTLSLGIIASMFTAILLTRMLIVLWVKSRRQKKLPI
jgi:preprotein translocase subunit SecD